jgi:hypothetical protein
MQELNFTIVNKRATPLVQFLTCLLIGWAGIAVVRFLHLQPGTEYFAAFLGIILFTIVNTIISIASNSYVKYTVPSYGFYVALVAVLFLSSKYSSGISIWNLWEYRMMFTSVTMFYFIISTLVRAVRFLFDAAS